MGSTVQSAAIDPFLSIKCLLVGILIQLILCSKKTETSLYSTVSAALLSPSPLLGFSQ
ncbi:hypothetical protein P7K49_019374, partial [Saguinus oedipus]